jgi:hypothetical protein
MIDPALADKEKLRITARSLSVLLRAGATRFEPSLAIQFYSSNPIGAEQRNPTSNSVSGQIRLLSGSMVVYTGPAGILAASGPAARTANQ